MNIDPLISAAAVQRLTDVLLLGVFDVEENPCRFYQTQGGPLCFEFERESVVLEQPLGRATITATKVTPAEWIAGHTESAAYYRHGVFSVFELFFFRCDFFTPHPTIDRLIDYRTAGTPDETTGLVMELSTGGIIGIDPSSDQGLRFFLDGHLRIFEGELSSGQTLKKHCLWQRPK